MDPPEIIDLTEDYPTPSSQALPSSEASEHEAEGSIAGSSLKWYKKVNKRMGRGGHPYACQAIAVQGASGDTLRYEDVKFWPYVGPLNPWKTPRSVEEAWNNYDNTVAICAQKKMIVGRCTDRDPWKVLWEMDVDDDLYTLAWTYHLFTCHPLIAVAGKKGFVHIIDAVLKRCLRVLRGHGGDILRLAVHPTHPHIIASTSYDKTTRIWNILGSDLPIIPAGERYNENFPMGDADEGDCTFAILAGEGRGGHRAYVADAAFHPTKNAVATVGLDRQVKIWPLPQLPKPSINPLPTPIGYKAKIVHLPLFSTSKLHADFVDNVEWLNEYTLMTRSRKEVKIWEWTAFSRFFRPDSLTSRTSEPSSADYTDSGSFSLVSEYPIGSDCWAMNASFHRQFTPTSQEVINFEKNEHLVTDPLIALTAHRESNGPLPEILLFNPLLAEDGVSPTPITRKRLRDRRDSSSSNENDSEHESSEFMSSPEKTKDGQRSVGRPRKIQSGRSMESSSFQNGTSTPGRSITKSEGTTSVSPEKQSGTQSNKSLEPWRLVATDYQALMRQNRQKGLKIFAAGTNLCNVAISPRGAEWIIGVGEPGTVFVWKIDI
ncbi:uncharacterized protein I206_107520 [Kwoniella pini CBS 10737]|uniref:Uncharacterized protein n=1 Tax=Kwoniella pini CBS 10737 TaxID=1296096 RepID=A0A1B9HXI7_9TREE|nr:uncharacterized protein I206_05848 [Kwoniella pini CBS 10737]OCF47982.1 hypothetical protein I206_05848 [Kwoniella pini CBS 10737]